MSLLSGALDGVDLRAALPELLAAVAGAGDTPLEPLFTALAERDALALAEVACGPRAPGGASSARAALPHAAALEGVLSARGLYPRLADLAGAAGPEVLAVAAARHPAASWLVALSRKVERDAPGRIHLEAAAAHPSFAAVCAAHAQAGHLEALVAVAGTTGRAEPAAALLTVDVASAVRAAGAALDRSPGSPVLPHLAAVWGPDADALFLRLIPHLRSRAAADALHAQVTHFPRTAATLSAVLRGML